MRFVLSFISVLMTLTLVSRSAFPAPQFYTSGSDSHAHKPVSSGTHDTVFLNGFLAHEHAHGHEEHGSGSEDSATPAESSSPDAHSHSHVHILIESAAWIAADSTLNTSIIIPPTATWSVAEESYVFNFLSRIFRPPIS